MGVSEMGIPAHSSTHFDNALTTAVKHQLNNCNSLYGSQASGPLPA